MEGSKLPELWAGVECTTNRVRDHFFHQLDRSGHVSRVSDFERFASLGIKALRQPVLWERVAPDSANEDWEYSDVALARLAELGIRPIVGLVHHGSGPRHTSLLDSEFAEKLSRYALRVAERYPWVEHYTPVNEPLTTARFSALYGHWYPHTRDDRSFVAALVNQCRAIVLSMRAIRTVNSKARLVQTDDFGKTYATPKVKYQADFDNERRWLGWDLVSGRVTREHALWGYLIKNGVGESELAWFENQWCSPDVIGINHYISSDRFLDDNLFPYPADTHGSNGRHAYADVLAARVLDEMPPRSERIREAWDRYHKPVALTEVHNGCTREEQLRWLHELWTSSVRLRECGVDLHAVTLWSLLGAFDWDCLVTQERGRYEPGVFDLRSKHPRPTAIASLARDLAGGRTPVHPVLHAPGWWKRPERFLYRTTHKNGGQSSRCSFDDHWHAHNPRPVAILSSGNGLGDAFAAACKARGLPCAIIAGTELDARNIETLRDAVERLRPWAVINAVDIAETEGQESPENHHGTMRLLASECASRGVALLMLSSDLVFDGAKSEPYVESDSPCALGTRAQRQAELEASIFERLPTALVLRVGPVLDTSADHWLGTALRTLAAGKQVRAQHDKFSLTYGPDLVEVALDLLIDGESGIWHLANPGMTSWAGLLRSVAEKLSLSPELVQTTAEGFPGGGFRPPHLVLGSEKAWIMPPLESAIDRYIRSLSVESDLSKA